MAKEKQPDNNAEEERDADDVMQEGDADKNDWSNQKSSGGRGDPGATHG